jgi:hypothetical protein
VQQLKASINVSVNPCDDFFAYTCGNFNAGMSFEIVQTNNMLAVARHARKEQVRDWLSLSWILNGSIFNKLAFLKYLPTYLKIHFRHLKSPKKLLTTSVNV